MHLGHGRIWAFLCYCSAPSKHSKLDLEFWAVAVVGQWTVSLFCFAAFLLSHHTNEQPRESPVFVDCYAALLLWTGSCLLCHRLHPWHAHLGFHGCRGKVLSTVIRFLNICKETRLFEKVFSLWLNWRSFPPPHKTRVTLCSPGYPGTPSACLYLPSGGIKGVQHYHLAEKEINGIYLFHVRVLQHMSRGERTTREN